MDPAVTRPAEPAISLRSDPAISRHARWVLPFAAGALTSFNSAGPDMNNMEVADLSALLAIGSAPVGSIA